MDFDAFSSLVFDHGKGRLDEMELFYTSRRALRIEVFNQKVDNYIVSDTAGVALRAVGSLGMGQSFTEKMDERSAELLVEEAYQNGQFTDADERPNFAKANEARGSRHNISERLENIQTNEKIQMMINLETEALSLDNRVSKIQMCTYEDNLTERKIRNSLGLSLEDSSSLGYVYISVVAEQEDDVSTGSSFAVFRDPGEIDISEIAMEAVEEATSLLGAKPISSGNYGAIIKNRAFVDIIEGFMPAFSGLNVQRGLSFLKGRIGEVIGSPKITIIEDPFLQDGFASCDFDDEGFRTTRKTIIHEGRLKEFLYDSRSSKKEVNKTSGNGFRDSIKSTVGTRPTNLLVEKGSRELVEIIEEMDSGILITDLAGLHSGLDFVSGDFSLQAQGFTVENGLIGEPVKGITISGNMIQLLAGIEEVADDIFFGLPGNGCYGSPSIKIDSISVSGY